MIKHIAHLLLIGLLSLAWTPIAFGDVRTKAVQEALEFMAKKFGKEMAEEGAETVGKRLTKLAAKHGDEVVTLSRKHGPKVLNVIEEAGEHGDQVVKFVGKHGDEAIWVVSRKDGMAIFIKYGEKAGEAMVKHGSVGQRVIEAAGEPAARALCQLSKQNGRRLAMVMDEGVLPRSDRFGDLLIVIEKWGDKAMEFIWRNKGSLTVAAVLAAFLSDPEPFINGTRDLAEIAADSTVKPVAESAGKAMAETVTAHPGLGILSLVVGGALVTLLVLLIASRFVARIWNLGRVSKV
ncbi:MAG: hypothetical protein NZM31_14025 [Gemmatales bacterium]|nr:hypothetical protein [Gemmatales bacterium]MDW8388114.1 hypothetical protein [Gemmatales bacterium]